MFAEMVHRGVLLGNGNYYKVIWRIELEGHIYLYLLNANDFSDLLFCERISDEDLEEITDVELLDKVILSMAKQINTFMY